MNSKGYTLPIILFLLIAVTVLFVFIYRNLPPKIVGLSGSQTTSSVMQKPTEYTKISGALSLMPNDLKLMTVTSAIDDDPVQKEEEKNQLAGTKYYNAGVYQSGKYKGYTRIIALRPYNNMIGYEDYLLATKDFKTYVLNGDSSKIEKDKKPEELTYEDPRYELDLTKVTQIDYLPQTTPEELPLNETYGLHKDRWNALFMEQPDYNNYSALKLITDTSNLRELPTPNKDFRMFERVDQNPPKELAKYVTGETTGVYVQDSSGVIYHYSQTSTVGNKEYAPKLAEYDQKTKEYEQKMREIDARIQKHKVDTGKDDLQVDDYPMSPDTVYTPSFTFDSLKLKDVILSSGSFFVHYQNAFPHPCGDDRNTYITQNIKDSELQKIATVDGHDVYLLIDAAHPIYKISYDLKKKPNDDIWREMNYKPDEYFKKMPGFNEYLSKRPLLFIKDFWGRIAVLQEHDFTIVSGCGKPVVYLYPQNPTDVSLNFTAPMSLSIQIPSYANGWKVKAYPDGKLVDLQPEFTKCDLIKNDFGSEYAKSACAKNEYPYIYWAGQSSASNYPKITEGWIVGSREVESTLRAKLTEIGLSEKEQNDFLEYWLPEIKKQNAPFYRLSLLQNNELNKLFPMNVSPKPDSVIRVFLDFLPLASSAEVNVEPEKVQHYNRNGFTLVEWGGLHR